MIKTLCVFILKKVIESQNHKSWKGFLVIIKSKLLLEQIPYSRSHRKASREGDSTTILGSLLQCFVTGYFSLLKSAVFVGSGRSLRDSLLSRTDVCHLH